MEKRILLAFILSFAVLFAFRWVFPPPAVGPTVDQTATTPVSPPPSPSQPAPPQNLPSSSTVAEPLPAEGIHAEKAEDVVIDNTLYTARLSNRGGVLTSFKLKGFRDGEGHPTELIDGASARQIGTVSRTEVGWPLAINTDDAMLDGLLAARNFAVQREGQKVSFEFAENGIHARKTIEFDPENYTFKIETFLSKNGQSVPHRLLWQAGFGDQSLPADLKVMDAVYDSGTSYPVVTLAALTKAGQTPVASRVGAEDQYFLAMMMLPQPRTVNLNMVETTTMVASTGVTDKIFAFIGGGKVETPAKVLRIAVPSGQPLSVYIGPKVEAPLVKADPQLESVVNYGWFGFIAKPLMGILLWIHRYVGNFGWSIILLTCLINFCLFPLRLKSQISMQKMQKLQPKMNTLQDKYKKLKTSDPRRAEVQAEMMSLYSENGINPMGGCLPLLLQMPLLYAFYAMLRHSIELRGAPWILWIHDLARYDPHWILPGLMMVSMILVQKMTPTTVDPTQAKVMMIMPIMFSMIFLWVQSGLQLYWLTSNVVQGGQQWLIRKYWSDPPDIAGKTKLMKAKPSGGD